MKAIIVDDESRARGSLQKMLQLYCPEVELVALVENVPKAVLAIKAFKPDLVFLDVEMPDFNGFELVKFFDSINFEVVFVTAYSEYAIQAFEISAIDYLLKPVQIDKLKSAVQKVNDNLEAKSSLERLQVLQQNLQADEFTKIALPVLDGLLFVEINKLSVLQAEGAYTNVFLKDGSTLLVSKKIKFFEEHLTKRKNFFRIHRSFIINLNFIKKYNRLDSSLVMENGVSLPISKERKKEFEDSFQEIRIGK